MAIHAISGKPGGGKSMYAVKLILDELLYGSRVVITNLPLKVAALNEYLQREYPHKTIDLHFRVRFLDEDTTGKFWTFRPDGVTYAWVKISELNKVEWQEGKKPSYSAVNDSGVMYVIDECHNFFNARAWAETGRDVLFYLSQHRKLGDTVIWITQAVMNVDKQFRSVTQDYTYLRNLSKEKMGLFRLPSYFVRKTYGQPATDTTQPMEIGSFKLDCSGLASLYDTAAGVGIHNKGGADTAERKKGIHWMVVILGVPALILGIYFTVPRFFGWFFDPRRHMKREDKPMAGSPPQASELDPSVGPKGVRSFADKGTLPLTLVQSNVDMVGYAMTPRFSPTGDVQPLGTARVRVWLSDGRTYQSRDGHLQYVCEDYCIVDGATNWYHPVQKMFQQSDSLPLAPDLPVTQNYSVTSQADEQVGSSLYVIPNHVNTMSHPAVKTSVAGGLGSYSPY